MCNINSL